MKSLLTLALLLTALVNTGAAQYRLPPNQFQYFKSTSLSGAVETVTLQQPASGSRDVQAQYATLYCSVACVWTLSVDGTGATTTAATEIEASGEAVNTANVFHTSNVGSPTTIGKIYLGAGQQQSVDLTAQWLTVDGIGENLSLGTDSITGTAEITLVWREY